MVLRQAEQSSWTARTLAVTLCVASGFAVIGASCGDAVAELWIDTSSSTAGLMSALLIGGAASACEAYMKWKHVWRRRHAH